MKIKDKNSYPGETTASASLSIIEMLLNREGQAIKSILDKITIGIVILNYKKRVVLFVNEYYDSLAPPQKKEGVLTKIYRYLDANINLTDIDLTIFDKYLDFLKSGYIKKGALNLKKEKAYCPNIPK